ncbi:hypothetical protein OHR68_20655 [Spirillospora sp. NBC_00431]
MSIGEFAEIHPPSAEAEFDRLSAKATTLESSWNRARQLITAGEAGIGGDKIAQAFRGNYDPPRDTAQRTADPLPGAFRRLVAAGRASAADYQTGDGLGASAIQTGGVPPIRGPR